MQIDTEEVVRSYKQALNKTEQVLILAELTLSDTDTILEILRDAGVLKQYEVKKRICARCGREFVTRRDRGVMVCDHCAETKHEIAILEQKIKRNVAHIANKLREIGDIAERNKKIRREIDKLKESFK